MAVRQNSPPLQELLDKGFQGGGEQSLNVIDIGLGEKVVRDGYLKPTGKLGRVVDAQWDAESTRTFGGRLIIVRGAPIEPSDGRQQILRALLPNARYEYREDDEQISHEFTSPESVVQGWVHCVSLDRGGTVDIRSKEHEAIEEIDGKERLPSGLIRVMGIFAPIPEGVKEAELVARGRINMVDILL